MFTDSVFKVGKNYYFYVYLELSRYIVKEKNVSRSIKDKFEISYDDSEKEDSDQSDKESSDESNEKAFSKEKIKTKYHDSVFFREKISCVYMFVKMFLKRKKNFQKG